MTSIILSFARRKATLLALACIALTAAAQETYDNATLATTDLNGTARYVGMGGALDALGADISVINTNPAGIALFRHSTASVSAGVVSQENANDFHGGDGTAVSLDQVGMVYSKQVTDGVFINSAFNYHKTRNFTHILSAANALSNASQNKQSYLKGEDGTIDVVRKGSGYVSADDAFSQVDYLYYNMLLGDSDGSYYYNDASAYTFNRRTRGYIGEYDFCLSGNSHDRFYWGLTVGIADVHYNSYSEYSETLLGDGTASIGTATLTDQRRITGTGFNATFGIIVRPVETSPLRIGLSVATPTWYSLTTENTTSLSLSNWTADYGQAGTMTSSEVYDFSLNTPWRFGASVGTVFARRLAVGITYDYANYSHLDSRYNTGTVYDWNTETHYEETAADKAMNSHTRRTLRSVGTVKIGAELKASKSLAVRVGYNHVSPMYETAGYKDSSVSSLGTYYSSTTDYVNWGDTDRLTLGIGFMRNDLTLDLAYQYSAQSGNFYAFTNQASNPCSAVSVKNNRSQVVATLGVHF